MQQVQQHFHIKARLFFSLHAQQVAKHADKDKSVDETFKNAVHSETQDSMTPLGCLFCKIIADLVPKVVKAGLPLPGVQVRIAAQLIKTSVYEIFKTTLFSAELAPFQAQSDNLDADMPRGQPGELLVRGPWIIQDKTCLAWCRMSPHTGYCFPLKYRLDESLAAAAVEPGVLPGGRTRQIPQWLARHRRCGQA